MAQRIFLSNDQNTSAQIAGYDYDEEVFVYPFVANATSIIATSTVANAQVLTAKGNGVIQDCWIAVSLLGSLHSTSGFMSGCFSAEPRINSAATCSTQPQIIFAANSSLAVRGATNNAPNSCFVSAVMNVASNAFSTGDQITVNWAVVSASSGAAPVAGTGGIFGMKLRYNAR